MKITIDLEEVEALRKKIRNLESEKRELELKITNLDEKVLIDKAVRLSKRLFTQYIDLIFEKLNFDQKADNSVSIDDLEHYLGADWYNQREKIKMTIGADITNHYKTAFLRLGVIIEERPREKKHKLE